MGQRKDCLVKYVFFAVLMLVLCGCAQCDRLVLSTGESVETLYYHECRMPDEVMTEMWSDFPSRRLRVKSNVEKFWPREMPAGAEYMREIVRCALGRGGDSSLMKSGNRSLSLLVHLV